MGAAPKLTVDWLNPSVGPFSLRYRRRADPASILTDDPFELRGWVLRRLPLCRALATEFMWDWAKGERLSADAPKLLVDAAKWYAAGCVLDSRHRLSGEQIAAAKRYDARMRAEFDAVRGARRSGYGSVQDHEFREQSVRFAMSQRDVRASCSSQPRRAIVPRPQARRRGAGRPRAAAVRSSSRSGDSGDDDPAAEPPPLWRHAKYGLVNRLNAAFVGHEAVVV